MPKQRQKGSKERKAEKNAFGRYSSIGRTFAFSPLTLPDFLDAHSPKCYTSNRGVIVEFNTSDEWPIPSIRNPTLTLLRT
jgi:hypothetical protein